MSNKHSLLLPQKLSHFYSSLATLLMFALLHILMHVYSHRFIADILNDTAIFLELISPMFPAIFLLILCIASVTKVTMVINLSNVTTGGYTCRQ